MASFTFEAPEGASGAKLRLHAPDGATLLVTLMPQVQAGASVMMVKDAAGRWTSELAKEVQTEDLRFSFTVPPCSPGSKLKIEAPDKVTLLVPVPDGLQPGSTVTMVKGPDGQWKFDSATPTAAAPSQWLTQEEMNADLAGPGTATVQLNTTKGPLKIRVVEKWAPLGVNRFLQMIADGFYQEIAIYRGMQRGLVQFGIVQDGDPRAGLYKAIEDDKLCGVPYAEGIVGFAAAGPRTRKHTVCIMKADFRSQLGKGALGSPSTETPFGMVLPESMAVLDKITCLGDIPQCGGSGPDPHKIEAQGNAYLRQNFPTCDYIISADRLD